MSPTAESKLATGQWKVYKQQLQALHALMGTQKVTLEARRRQREGKATSQKKLAKEYCYREWEREAGAQEARRFDGSPHLLELLPLVDAQGCLCEDSSSCSSGGGGGDAQLAQRFLELLARVSATGPLRDQAMLVLVLRRTATLRRRRRDGGGNGGEPAGSAALERFTRWGGLEVLKAMLGDCLARRERPGAEGKEAGELLELVLKTLLALPPDPEAARDANLPRFVKAMFGGQQQQQARSSGGKGSKSLQALAEQVVERFMRPLAVNRRESPTPSAPSASSSSSAAAAAASAGAAAASASAPKAEKPVAAAAIERQPSDAEAEVVGAKRPRPTPAAGSAAATAAAADAAEAERAKRIQLQQRGKGGGIKVVRPEVQVKKTPLGASPMDVDQPPSSSPRAEEGASSAVAFPSAQALGESHGAAAGGGGGGGVGWESAGLPVLTSFTEARKSKARKRVRWVDHEGGKPLQEVFLFEKYLGTLTAEEVAAAAEGGGGAGAGGEEGQAHHATVKELAKREHLNEADALAKRKFASGAVSLPWRRPRALPPLLFGPERDQPAPVPASAEAALQSARMRGRVEAMYLSKADIPRTPSEDLATVKAPAAGHGPAAAPEAIPWELDAVEAPPDVSDSPPPTTAASRLPPPPPPPPPPQPPAQPTAGATAAAPAPLGGLLGALLAQPALMQAATAQLQQQQQQQQRYNPPLPPGPPPPGSQYYPPPLPAPAPAAPAAPQADALLQLQALLAGIPGTRAAGGGGGGGGLLGPTSGGGGYGGGRGGYPQQQQQRQQQAYNPPGDQYYGGGGGGRGRGGRGGQGRGDGGGYGRGGQYNNRR